MARQIEKWLYCACETRHALNGKPDAAGNGTRSCDERLSFQRVKCREGNETAKPGRTGPVNLWPRQNKGY
jgi:hypothetical protein